MILHMTMTINNGRRFGSCASGLTAACQYYLHQDEDTEIKVSEMIKNIGLSNGLHCTAFSVQGMTEERIKWGLLLGAELSERAIFVYEGTHGKKSELADCVNSIRKYISGEITKEKLDEDRKLVLSVMAGLENLSKEKLAARSVYCAAGISPEDLFSAARYAARAIAKQYPKEGCCGEPYNTAEIEELSIQKEIILKWLS